MRDSGDVTPAFVGKISSCKVVGESINSVKNFVHDQTQSLNLNYCFWLVCILNRMHFFLHHMIGPAMWEAFQGSGLTGRRVLLNEGMWDFDQLGPVGNNAIQSIQKLGMSMKQNRVR